MELIDYFFDFENEMEGVENVVFEFWIYCCNEGKLVNLDV